MTAGAAIGGGERLVGAAAQAALAQRHPQAAAWLAQRRPALTLHVVEFPAPEQVRRRAAGWRGGWRRRCSGIRRRRRWCT
jgi:hypothetical protein